MADRIPEPPSVDSGGLPRRALLRGAAVAPVLLSAAAAAAPEVRHPGGAMSPRSERSPFAGDLQRLRIRSRPGTTGSGASATPLEQLHGTLTPADLHFERHHSGVPAIDPALHRLAIFGAVERPLVFDVDSLLRYPMVTVTRFLECSGNSAPQLAADPVPWTCGEIHGLLSCSQWSGVPLALLLDEAGVAPDAGWVVAEGADAGRMNRSVPLAKCMDDALVALYQNGEPLRPANGYPLRLLLPGWEGNMSIKWLRALEVTRAPAMTREETSRYTDLGPDGIAQGFTFAMGVKSVITSPSPGLGLGEHGVYQVTGLAWSGAGRIRRVEVSVDGGRSWTDAAFESEPQPLQCARFRAAWRWQGEPALLMSRAHDDTGAVQPRRAAWLEAHGRQTMYHYNAVQAWQVEADGTVHNSHA